MKKLLTRYKNQKGYKKFLVQFILNWIYWFAVRLVFEIMWPGDEPRTWKERLLFATWMAFWWTFLWEGWILKLVTRKREKKLHSNHNDQL